MSRLRKTAAVVCLTSGLFLASTVAIHSMADESESNEVEISLNEIKGSGVSGSASYGTTIEATATGLDPDKDYFSFVYGAGSSATGNNPCILTGESLVGPGNTVGRWVVDADGNGTLSADAPMSPERAGTLSIREDVTNTGGSAGPLPLNTLVACGQIGERQVTPLGTVQDQLPGLPSTKSVTDVTGGLPDGVLDNSDDSGSTESDNDSNSNSDDSNSSNDEDSNEDQNEEKESN